MKDKFLKRVLLVLFFLTSYTALYAQGQKELKYYLSKDSTEYVKLTFANQVWVRYTQNNPGSTINGKAQDETFDIGLRRTRLQLFGKTSPHTFFYLQLGQNNFNYLSTRKTGFFIHDALGEVNVNKHFGVGAGLTAWTGFSRFSSPGVASIMALDAPLFLQATNDANDQFLRKLSVYAKGKLGKLDYRLILSKPFMFTTSSLYSAANKIDLDSKLSPEAPHVQGSCYVSWQFFDQESDDLPYQVGTYLGKKKVLNLGAGVQFQQDAMWNLAMNGDTVRHDMLLASVDLFYDAPVNATRGDAISIYAVATHYDFGRNYIRNSGPMNVTDGLNSNGKFNGTGILFPMIGSGNSVYLQAGYLTGKLSQTKSLGMLMPYLSAQVSKYDQFEKVMIFGDAGISWYLDGARSKLTFGVQNRPVYEKLPLLDFAFKMHEISRLNSFILQYQVSI